MTKHELAKELQKAMTQEFGGAAPTQKVCAAIIEAFSGVLVSAIQTHGEVTMPGIGKLSVKERAARMGRNPRTGEAVEIKARRTLRFIASKTLKEAIR